MQPPKRGGSSTPLAGRPGLRADPPEVSTPKTPDRGRRQASWAHAAPPRATASASMGSDLPRSRADTRLRAIRCGGQRTTRHGPAASNSRSRRPVTDRLSSTAHVRSVPNRVVAHCMASACPLLFAETVFWPSLRPPLSMATSVCVRLCASMPMTVIEFHLPSAIRPVRSGGSPDSGMQSVSQSGKTAARGRAKRRVSTAGARRRTRRRAAIPHAVSRHYDTQPSQRAALIPESQAVVIGMTARTEMHVHFWVDCSWLAHKPPEHRNRHRAIPQGPCQHGGSQADQPRHRNDRVVVHAHTYPRHAAATPIGSCYAGRVTRPLSMSALSPFQDGCLSVAPNSRYSTSPTSSACTHRA